MDLPEISLCSSCAQMGMEVRLIGNNAGEKISHSSWDACFRLIEMLPTMVERTSMISIPSTFKRQVHQEVHQAVLFFHWRKAVALNAVDLLGLPQASFCLWIVSSARWRPYRKNFHSLVEPYKQHSDTSRTMQRVVWDYLIHR